MTPDSFLRRVLSTSDRHAANGRHPVAAQVAQQPSAQPLQRLGHVGERRTVPQRARLPLQQRDVVLPVVAGLARVAQPVVAGHDGVVGHDDHAGRVQPGTHHLPMQLARHRVAVGRQRPLGIAALEDKIVQRAVVVVLNAIYEEDFLGFSYGFRPGRGQHDALDALCVAIKGRRVNWILDADIKGFFDAVDHSWLLRFLKHRIGDERINRLVGKWLTAGVLEDRQWSASEQGTPQGAVISPLLANVYLHYVFDLWAQQWRRREVKGDMIVVRYADDLVVGFKSETEARRFLDAMRERFGRFSLELHGEKTRLLEFGRYAIERRQRNGQGKPQTFNFLGFTFICSRSRRGAFLLRRQTRGDRMRAALREIKDELRRRRHDSLADQGRWLRSVVTGYFAYHAVPTNAHAIGAYRHHVIDLWRRSLKRRSQKDRMTWARMDRLAKEWLPPPHVLHPWPEDRFAVTHPR